jgi:RNA polymerase sigma-70 factor (ECF subfamily)
MQVVARLHTFEGGVDNFRGWLFRIAQHKLIDQRRRASFARGSHASRDNDACVATQTSIDVADIVQQQDADAHALRALAILPHDQRAVIFMRYALDMQPAQIADVLLRPVSAVKMLQQRGLAALRARAAASPLDPSSS